MDVRLPSWRFGTLVKIGRQHNFVLFGQEGSGRHSSSGRMFVCPPSTDESPAKTLTYSIHPNFDVVAAAAVMLHLGHGLPEVFRGSVPAQQLTYLVVNTGHQQLGDINRSAKGYACKCWAKVGERNRSGKISRRPCPLYAAFPDCIVCAARAQHTAILHNTQEAMYTLKQDPEPTA